MFSVGASCPVHSARRMSLSSAWLGSTSSAGVRQFRFPDSGPNGRALRRDYGWTSKAEYFGVDLKIEVSVESEIVEPGAKIKGNLVIDTKFPIEHDGIFIELEAFCSLNYSTKHNERTTVHKGKGCILEHTKVNTFGHLESPIKCEVIPITPPEFGGHSINSGVWHYPFQLQVPCDPILPAPFQNSHGNLDYRLVVYMISHSSSTYVKLTEKGMKCDGHYNLYDVEEASKPIVIEQFYRKSYFSQKKLVKATLSVQNAGFLELEEIPFSLYIKNPKCIPLHMSVTFLQHVKYQASSNLTSVVKIVTTVESLEKDECEEPKPEIQWVGTLHVPDSLTPSYTCNSMYGVSYLLEFQVKSLEELIITGQANILLGTTREPVKPLDSTSEIHSSGELHRSGSESSLHSQRSIYSTPIAYSVPANLNLSIDEPDDEDDEDNVDAHARRSTETRQSQSLPYRNRTEHDPNNDAYLREDAGESSESGMTTSLSSSAPFPATSTSSLHSTDATMSLPPSYSQLSSRIPSTETLPPTYADLDLNVESLPHSSALLIGDAVDLEKRYSINLDSLNVDDEFQVTFYSV